MSTLDTSVRRDQNRVPVWWGISSSDGITLVPIAVDSSNGVVEMEVNTSTMPVMSSLPAAIPRDGNRIPCLYGVSNADDNVLLPVSVNPSTGAIQAQTI